MSYPKRPEAQWDDEDYRAALAVLEAERAKWGSHSESAANMVRFYSERIRELSGRRAGLARLQGKT